MNETRNTPTVSVPALATETAVELLEKDIPPICMVIGGYVPAGLLLLAGDPKVGKTLLMMSLAVSIATGTPAWGEVEIAQGDCLYVALEGGQRSIRARLDSLTDGKDTPDRFHLAYECRGLGDGLAMQLQSWLLTVDDPRLVVIDTFAAVAPEQRGVNRLTEEYRSLQPLAELSKDWPETLFVVLHHTRKAESSDVMHRINGGMGLTAATDCNAVFERKPGASQCVLSIRPRDAEESELTLELDQSSLDWTVIGTDERAQLSTERQKILELFDGLDEPVGPSEVAKQLRTSDAATRRLLMKMVNDRQIVKVAHGKYLAAGHNGHVGNDASMK